MSSDLEDVLRKLRESAESAADVRIELSNEYLALIARVEALPENQPGAHKSARWIGGRPEAEASLRSVHPMPRRR